MRYVPVGGRHGSQSINELSTATGPWEMRQVTFNYPAWKGQRYSQGRLQLFSLVKRNELLAWFATRKLSRVKIA